MLGGLLLLITGLVLLISNAPDVQFKWLLFNLAICGLGVGPSMPLYTLAIQNATEKHLIGQATSACQFSRQIGGVFTSTILGVILTFSLSGSTKMSPVAYTAAICHVNDGILVLVIAAFVATIYVPELALVRKTVVLS